MTVPIDIAVQEEREIEEKERHIRSEIETLEREISELKQIRLNQKRNYCIFYDYGECIFSGFCSDKDPGDEWPYYKNACNLHKDAINMIHPGIYTHYNRINSDRPAPPEKQECTFTR